MCHPHDIVQHTTLIFALISPTLLTLVHYPRYPRQQNNHVTHSGTPPASPTLARYPCKHAPHASTPPTLARHPRKYASHATHASMPPTEAHYPCHPYQHATHATHANHANHASTNSTPFLKLFFKQGFVILPFSFQRNHVEEKTLAIYCIKICNIVPKKFTV